VIETGPFAWAPRDAAAIATASMRAAHPLARILSAHANQYAGRGWVG
jgi:hypothetical protein